MKNKHIYMIFIIQALCCCTLFPQENYFIVSDSREDSLWCSEHCPFYDFDSHGIIIGGTIPDQMVELRQGNLIQLQKSIIHVMENNFRDNLNEIPLELYVVVDTMGKARGIIANTISDNNIPAEAAARIAFDHIKTEKFLPASLHGTPITYGFSLLTRKHHISQDQKL